MATQLTDEELQGQQAQGSTAGATLAGNSGEASPGQQAGSGWTNLQTYLDANRGQGAGIAKAITDQGQQTVDQARGLADTQAKDWASKASQSATDAGNNAAFQYDSAAQGLRDNPNYDPVNTWGTTYGGPQDAKGIDGYNDLEKAYDNVRNTANNFANDRETQQAGLQKQFNYGTGFAALDGFLGRQDGKQQIQDWAKNANTGSAQPYADQVNQSIAGAKQQVDTARAGFEQANRDAKAARSNTKQTAPKVAAGTGIADQSIIPDPLKQYLDPTSGTYTNRQQYSR